MPLPTAAIMPPTARICVRLPAAAQRSPNIQGTNSGATAISPNSSGNRSVACTRIIRARILRICSRSSARESTGKAMLIRIWLIFDW